jgi:hypothetical protein
MDYVKFIYRPLAARAAHHVLVGRHRVRQSPDRGRFTRADVDDLLKSAWVHYAERVGKLRPEPTVGSRMNVRLACFTMSFFNALLARSVVAACVRRQSCPNPGSREAFRCFNLDYALAITRTKIGEAVFIKEADMGPPVRAVPVYEFAASLQPQLPPDS